MQAQMRLYGILSTILNTHRSLPKSTSERSPTLLLLGEHRADSPARHPVARGLKT